MKITLDISDCVICAFFSGIRIGENGGMEMFSHQLDAKDLMHGKTTKLPREQNMTGCISVLRAVQES